MQFCDNELENLKQCFGILCNCYCVFRIMHNVASKVNT